jgi:hypothetical protein
MAIWIATHFAAGYTAAAVVLGVLFLVTAILGTVTNDDIAAAGISRAPKGRHHLFYYHDRERKRSLPAFFQMSKTSEPRLICGFAPEGGVVVIDSSNVRISNRFGETMKGVLNFLEWAVGMFYEIHFPTTLQATAKEVHDPNFGHQTIDVQQPDYMRMTETALKDPQCAAAVHALLKENVLVCPAAWFLRSSDGESLLAVAIYLRCLSLPGDTEVRSVSSDDLRRLPKLNTPLFTTIKFQLGILHTEVDQKDP